MKQQQHEIRSAIQLIISEIDDEVFADGNWDEIKKTALELEKIQLGIFYTQGSLEAKYSRLLKREEKSFEEVYKITFNH